MPNFKSVATTTLAAVLAAVLASVPAWAQDGQAGTAAATPGQGTADLPGVVATTNNPNLAVAAVKLENGSRLSKVIGATVYAESNEKVGMVDDLIMTGDNKVTVAIIAVGGVLGLGSKLVAVPFGQLKMDNDRVLLPGVTKDGLNLMPNFVY